jgi:sugar phosphate isomerase/epimerase
MRSDGTPIETRFSLSQLTLADSDFEQDVRLCSALGIPGLGVAEYKLPAGSDLASRALMDELAIVPTLGSPNLTSPLPSDHGRGPDDPDQRVELMCASVRRLAAFGVDCVFVVTGPARDYDVKSAWRIAVEGLREVLAAAKAAGVSLAFEPMRQEYHDDFALVHSIPEYLALVEEVGEDLKLLYDIYHLWDTADILPLSRRYAGLIVGVQVADYRDPPRNLLDRLLPGDGVAPLGAIYEALEEGGFRGCYDLEVFSSLDLPDSIWSRPRVEWVGEAKSKFVASWRG